MIKVKIQILDQELTLSAKMLTLDGTTLIVGLEKSIPSAIEKYAQQAAEEYVKNIQKEAKMYPVPEVKEIIIAEPAPANKPKPPTDITESKRPNFCRHFPGKICKSCSKTFTATHNCQKYCDDCKAKKQQKKAATKQEKPKKPTKQPRTQAVKNVVAQEHSKMPQRVPADMSKIEKAEKIDVPKEYLYPFGFGKETPSRGKDKSHLKSNY